MGRYQLCGRNNERNALDRVRRWWACKTEASQKPVPIHPLVVEALVKWNRHQQYRKLGDWVFASSCRRGRKPYWGQAVLRKYIRPKAQELGIENNFGWHKFRHTYSTLLRSFGTEFNVMQRVASALFTEINTRCLHSDDYTGQACCPGRRHVASVFSRGGIGYARVVRKVNERFLGALASLRDWGAKKAHSCVPFALQLNSANPT